MIKIIKNPNFPQFLEIFKDSTLIEEVQGRAKAFRIASKLAKKQRYQVWNRCNRGP